MKHAGRVALTAGKWTLICLGGLLVVLIVAVMLLPPLTRPLTDRWGATEPEVGAPLPGDELIADPKQVSTKAITIRAPADTVYSLLVQMGYGRGGWYGWDWFYNMTGSADFVGGRHAEEIVPPLQDFGVGDRMAINKMVEYDVLVADRPHTLLMATARSADGTRVAVTSPDFANGMTWSWVVREIGPGDSRLILRSRAGGRSEGAFVDWLYDKPLDLGGAVMGYKTLVGIRDTAERLAAQKR